MQYTNSNKIELSLPATASAEEIYNAALQFIQDKVLKLSQSSDPVDKALSIIYLYGNTYLRATGRAREECEKILLKYAKECVEKKYSAKINLKKLVNR